MVDQVEVVHSRPNKIRGWGIAASGAKLKGVKIGFLASKLNIC